jgi:signal peptidase I
VSVYDEDACGPQELTPPPRPGTVEPATRPVRPLKTGEACPESAPEEDTNLNFVKRIVAGPGDVIYIKEGHVYRNGKREKDPYIRPCGESSRECNFPVPIKIPPGHWFMMGDHRGFSNDSRYWGPVPIGWIVGGAFFTYWPPDRIGSL